MVATERFLKDVVETFPQIRRSVLKDVVETFPQIRRSGWRASMEDAHIALLRVPHGLAPSSAEIGAARIGISSKNDDPNPSGSGIGGTAAYLPNGAAGATSAKGARGRAGTYSAGDAGESYPPRQAAGGDVVNPGERRASTSACVEGGAGEGGGGSPGAGWKAVDLLEDAALFGVFDGHGGKSVADFCRERLAGLLAASPEIRAGNWKEGFPKVYHALDDLLLSGEGQEKSGGWGGSSRVDGVGVGCTIVTALLDRKRRQCYVAHAGDSRCVLCRAGRAVQLTRDHKPGLPSEYARIVAAGGHVSRVGRVNDNLNLSRAIGDMSYKRNRLRRTKDQIISAEPDVCRFQVTPGVDEFLLLACDGVWEMMDTTQVVAFVRSGLRAGTPPVEVCENLLDACLSPDPRGTRYAGCDNMTVVVVLLEGWEAALATKAYTPGLTFCGGRLGGVAEAAAALSATLPKMPKKLSNMRPPIPTEFRSTTATATTAPETATATTAVTPATATAATTATAAAAGASTSAATNRPSGEADAALPAGGDTATVDASDSSSTGVSAGSAASVVAGEKDVDAMSWPQRRIAAGKLAPPRTAHGIEFALASFTPPVLPIGYANHGSRASTGRIMHSTGTAGAPGVPPLGGTRPRSSSQIPSPSNSARRRNPHMRSATAPMLPSPLLHNRRPPPSEERLAAAAAIAVLGEVGAAGAVAAAAAAAAAEDNANSAYARPSSNGRPGRAQLDLLAEVSAATGGEGMGRQTAPSEDAGLVFVPAPDEMTPAEVTVTAKASPPRAQQHSE